LTFRASQRPLEEAMKDISQYFKSESIEPAPTPKENTKPNETAIEPSKEVEMKDAEPLPTTEALESPEMDTDIPSPSIITFASKTPNSEAPASLFAPQTNTEVSPPPPPPVSEQNSPTIPQGPTESHTASPPTPHASLTIYAAPTESTPLAARIPHNETDFIPTMEHASSHQARLLTESRNKRLPSDKELAARAEKKAAIVAAVSNINVRVRCPDGSLVQMTLGREDATGRKLYDNLREVVRERDGWVLKFTDSKGQFLIVSDDETVNLIKGLKWKGSILVYLVWQDGVDEKIKKRPTLRDEAMSEALSIKTAMPSVNVAEDSQESKGVSFMDGLNKAISKGKGMMDGAAKEAKLKNLLGFGKKK
jgi:tether containing UBX domain for GLUT4